MTPGQRDILEQAITIIEEGEGADEHADWLTEARAAIDTKPIDYNAIVANVATQFINGNGIWCRQAFRNMRSEEAAYVACGVYGNFISMDKEQARKWDDFLRRGV